MKDLLETHDIVTIKQSFDYTLRLGAVGLITGEVGSGKSTALRYVLSKLHPSEYKTIWITACSGSILEFYRLMISELQMGETGCKAVTIRNIRKAIREIVLEKKMKVLLLMGPLSRKEMEDYLLHHLSITGIKTNLFEDASITAVHQDSEGILRTANHLAKGVLVAAAKAHSMSVTADHVRLASTEIF